MPTVKMTLKDTATDRVKCFHAKYSRNKINRNYTDIIFRILVHIASSVCVRTDIQPLLVMLCFRELSMLHQPNNI